MSQILFEKYRYKINHEKKVVIDINDFIKFKKYVADIKKYSRMIYMMETNQEEILNLFIHADNVFIDKNIPFKLYYENRKTLNETSTIIKFIKETDNHYALCDDKMTIISHWKDFLNEEKMSVINKFAEYVDASQFQYMIYMQDRNKTKMRYVYDFYLKALTKNKKIMNWRVYRYFNKNFLRYLISVCGYHEILLNPCHNFPDLVHLLDVDKIIKMLNDGCEISRYLYNFVDEKIIGDKKLAIALAENSKYIKGQYIDEDVLLKYENLHEILGTFGAKLRNIIKKYGKYNKKIRVEYLLYMLKYRNEHEFSKSSLLELIEKYDFKDRNCNNEIITRLIKYDCYNLLEPIIKKMEVLPFIGYYGMEIAADIEDKLEKQIYNKFPFLIWIFISPHEELQKNIKKYYKKKDCYKYKIYDGLLSGLDGIKYREKLFILMQFYKYQKIFYSNIEMNINNNKTEKFVRQIIRTDDKTKIKNFIATNVTYKCMRYYDILSGIVDMNWKNSNKIETVKFIFL